MRQQDWGWDPIIHCSCYWHVAAIDILGLVYWSIGPSPPTPLPEAGRGEPRREPRLELDLSQDLCLDFSHDLCLDLGQD